MIDASVDAEITSHIVRVLLRYFRSAVRVDQAVERRSIETDEDLDLLKLHWSLGDAVSRLVEYILEHRHEAQSFLKLRTTQNVGVIRGRIDARASRIGQIVTGNPALTVSNEPIRSFANGPNHVLAWVLRQAWHLSVRFTSMLPTDATYRAMAEQCVIRLDRVRKIYAIKEAIRELDLSVRPSMGALRESAQSRRAIYRLAYRAYMELAAVEHGDLDTIGRLLSETLVAPIETWRRFELAVGLALAESLELRSGARLKLNLLGSDSRNPFAVVGRFGIYWQSRTPFYTAPALEPSEVIARDVLQLYGLRADVDRPDLVVVDLASNEVVAVVEAKYFTLAAEDAYDRLREAVHQIVRYTRGYRTAAEVRNLVPKCGIALVRKPQILDPIDGPVVFDFEEMVGMDKLKRWADRIRIS